MMSYADIGAGCLALKSQDRHFHINSFRQRRTNRCSKRTVPVRPHRKPIPPAGQYRLQDR